MDVLSIKDLKESNWERVLKNIFFVFFLIIVVGSLLVPKYFSKLNISIGAFPLYITELFIVLSVVYIIAVIIKNRLVIKELRFFWIFVFFFAVLLLALSIGLYRYRDMTYILRQSAVFYYAVFYFIVYLLFDDSKKIRYFMIALSISANILIIFFIINILGFSNAVFGNISEVFSGGFYFTVSLLFIIQLNTFELLRKTYHKILVYINLILFLIVAVLEDVRGNWIALVLAVIFSFIISKNRKKFAMRILILILVLILIAAVAYFALPQLFENTISEIRSMLNILFGRDGASSDIATVNANWRTIAWKAFLEEWTQSPLYGFGLGRKFLPTETFDMGWNTGLADNWVATHNYLITFLFTSGILGLAAFVLIIVFLFRENIRFLRSGYMGYERPIAAAFLSSVFYILILGLLEVVLEVPYQGIFLWIFFGFNMVIIDRVRSYEDTANT